MSNAIWATVLQFFVADFGFVVNGSFWPEADVNIADIWS